MLDHYVLLNWILIESSFLLYELCGILMMTFKFFIQTFSVIYTSFLLILYLFSCGRMSFWKLRTTLPNWTARRRCFCRNPTRNFLCKSISRARYLWKSKSHHFNTIILCNPGFILVTLYHISYTFLQETFLLNSLWISTSKVFL